MRLFGAALLAAAGLLLGLLAADELQRRVRRRESLGLLLERMAFELGRFKTPLPAVFAELTQLDGEAGALCRRVSEGLERLGQQTMPAIWAQAVQPLPAVERAILTPLGSVLGRYGVEEQLRALSAARTDMARAAAQARKDRQEKGRIYVGASAAGAVALAVLLL